MSKSSDKIRRFKNLLSLSVIFWPVSAWADHRLHAPETFSLANAISAVFSLELVAIPPFLMVFLAASLVMRALATKRSLSTDNGLRKELRPSDELVLRLSLDGVVIYASAAIEAALGYQPTEFLGKEFVKLVHDDDRLPFDVAFQGMDRPLRELSFVYRLKRQDDSYMWFESHCHMVCEPKTGTQTEIMIVSRDISRQRHAEIELESANRRLQMLSRTDTLTGVPNRRWFDEQASTELLRAVRSSTPVSLLVIDVDNLGAYNDRFGYEAGNEFLKAVANAVELSARRPGDFAGRYNGGTFAAVFPDTDIAGAVLLAEKIRISVEELAILDEHGVPMSVSVGAACALPAQSDGEESLTKVAKRALQNAKKAGRNAVRVAPVLSQDIDVLHRSVSTAPPEIL